MFNIEPIQVIYAMSALALVISLHLLARRIDRGERKDR